MPVPDHNGDLGVSPEGFPLGVLPSPADERDYPYPAFGKVYRSAELPEEYVCPGISRIDDQGATESCVAQSLGLMKDWQESREVGWEVRVSRQWLYANRGSYDHKGPGMVPRQALSGLERFGVVSERTWPGIVEYGREVWPAPREEMLPDAKPLRVASYLRLEPAFIVITKSAIYSEGPVMVCVAIHENFRPDSEGRIPLPSGSIKGYHAMAMVGWRRGAWLIQNSWGAGWGKGGRCWMSWDHPIVELWAASDAETVRTRKVMVYIGKRDVLIDGKPGEPMDTVPVIIDKRTMVPLRFLSEGLGAKVDWGPQPRVDWVTAEIRQHPWRP